MNRNWNRGIRKGQKARKFLAAILAIWVCFFPADQSFAEEVQEPSLTAQSAVLIDGDTGRVLFGKEEDLARPMASTTKIMTCILALENSSLDDVVSVSDYAASMPDVQLNIRPGETYRLEDLLYSLMLESHNDTAAAIAEHVAGTTEAFAKMMNQKARDIGCVNTNFITPNGLDAKNDETGEIHATTARELALILRYCISISPKKEEFLSITRAPSHSFSNIDGTRSFSCINHNALLTSMEGAVSGKTGFTAGAGYCYVGAVKKGDKTLIAALLGCGWPPHKTYKWQDMRKLVDFGKEACEYQQIENGNLSFEPVSVTGGIEGKTDLVMEETGETPLTLLMRKDETVTVRKKTPRSLEAPVAAGLVVGQVDYYVGDDLVASYPVKTVQAVGEWTFGVCAGFMKDRFLLRQP